MLLPFADSPTRYYSFLIPAMAIGTIGTTIIYSGSNIAVFMDIPPEMAGVVGGVYNSALQLGIALGLAALASITTSVDKKHVTASNSLNPGYYGVAAGYWFILGLVILFAIMILIFYKSDPSATDEEQRSGEHELKVRTRPGTARTSLVFLPSRPAYEQYDLESASIEKHTRGYSEMEDDDRDEAYDQDEKKDVIDTGVRRQSVRTSIISLPRPDADAAHGCGYDEEADHTKERSLTPYGSEPRRPERAKSRNSTVRFSLQLPEDNNRDVEVADTRSETRHGSQFNRSDGTNSRRQGWILAPKGEVEQDPKHY